MLCYNYYVNHLVGMGHTGERLACRRRSAHAPSGTRFAVPAQVLVVAADPADEAAAPWEALLHAAGYGVRTVTSLPQARALLTTQPVDAVLLVAPLSDCTVLPFCAELHQRLGPQVVLIVVCPPEVARLQVVALELGADDVVTTPVAADEVLARLAAHLRRSAPWG